MGRINGLTERRQMKITFIADRETKNTFRFSEKLEHEDDAPKIGTLYVQKAALTEIGWQDGETLTVEIGKE